MSSYRTRVPRLERITPAIGYVCIFWAWLDDWIGEMILKLCPFDPNKLTEKQQEQLDQIFRSTGDIRDKIRILRAVAFVRSWEEAWFKKVSKLLDHIDNDLRPQRNRIIHDCWGARKGGLQRRTRNLKFKRPQAFVLELSTIEHTPVRTKEVWSLANDIIKTMIALVRLSLEHDEIQKVVDTQVQEGVNKRFAQAIWAQFIALISKAPARKDPSQVRKHRALSQK